jgi:hypothetical protein
MMESREAGDIHRLHMNSHLLSFSPRSSCVRLSEYINLLAHRAVCDPRYHLFRSEKAISSLAHLAHTHSTSRHMLSGMATIRRLEDKDVRAIFECLHEGRPPPSQLSFQIVPVGPNGLKLSPPSYEFPGTWKQLAIHSITGFTYCLD